MIKIKVEADPSKIKLLAKNVPQRLRFNFVDAFDHIGRNFFKVFNQKQLSGRPGVKTHGPRGLGGRLHYRTLITNKEFGVSIYFARSLAALRQEYGEELTSANGGQRIAVPLSARGSYLYNEFGQVRKSFSLQRRMAREILPGESGLKTSVRPIKGKDGQWYLAVIKPGAKDPKDRVKPIFVLKDRVTIPPRLKFFDTWRSQEIQDDNTRILKEAMGKAVDEA